MTKHIDGKHAESAHMVMVVGNTGFRKSADFLTGLLESGTAAKPAPSAARGPAGLVSLSRVLGSLAEPPPDAGTAERRIQSLEKEVGEMKNRVDRLQKALARVLAKQGNFREIFAKTDG